MSKMLEYAGEHTSFAPSKIIQSSAQIHGETLSPETHLPIDRETGADLCSVKFPNNHSVMCKVPRTGRLNLKNIRCFKVQATLQFISSGNEHI